MEYAREDAAQNVYMRNKFDLLLGDNIQFK